MDMTLTASCVRLDYESDYDSGPRDYDSDCESDMRDHGYDYDASAS